MPQATEQQYNAAVERVIASAPVGLDEAAFNTLVERELMAPADSPQTTGGGMADALPMIGGMAGSLIGGSKASPVGMALAGVGGAGGEAFKQVVNSLHGDFSEVPETVGGRLGKIAFEGVKQGGLEGVGRVASAAVTPVAKTLYGVALRPAKALQREIGGTRAWRGLKKIIDQGFADRVMPSAMGVNRAERLVNEGEAAATGIAKASPARFDTARVMQKATDDQAKRSGAELTGAGIMPRVGRTGQIENIVKSNPPMVSAEELLAIRRGSDQVARPAFTAMKRSLGPRVVPGSEASVARSTANAARSSLNDALGPSFQKANDVVRTRVGLRQAVQDAASRPNMLTNLLAGGVGASALTDGNAGDAIKRAMIFRAVMSPTAQGATALAMPAVAKQLPRLLEMLSPIDQQAVKALMQGHK